MKTKTKGKNIKAETVTKWALSFHCIDVAKFQIWVSHTGPRIHLTGCQFFPLTCEVKGRERHHVHFWENIQLSEASFFIIFPSPSYALRMLMFIFFKRGYGFQMFLEHFLYIFPCSSNTYLTHASSLVLEGKPPSRLKSVLSSTANWLIINSGR